MPIARLRFAAIALLLPVPIGPSTAQTPQEGDDPADRPRVVAADIAFVQGMIHHHAQALVMTALVPGRTDDETMHLLAERITVSQQDEIRRMRRWLTARGETVPDPPVTFEHAHGHDHGVTMPGMLAPEELQALAADAGAPFERRFLECMIRHHEGAITMVIDLFGTPGAGQDSWMYRLAADIEADQRAEIARMRQLLAARFGDADPS